MDHARRYGEAVADGLTLLVREFALRMGIEDSVPVDVESLTLAPGS